jgi:hypothetical protein
MTIWQHSASNSQRDILFCLEFPTDNEFHFEVMEQSELQSRSYEFHFTLIASVYIRDKKIFPDI